MIKLEWADFKIEITNRNTPCHYVERENRYDLTSMDGPLVFTSQVDKYPSDTTELDDFEANFKPTANTSFTDGNGIALARTKITQTTWHYQMYGIEFETAKLGSMLNLDVDGSDLGHATLKFYDSSDVELTSGTQLELNLNCVKSVLDWEPPWDYEIIGGQFRQMSIPGSEVRLHVIAVPDLTTEQGGSVPFVNNINLQYLGDGDSIKTDGRTSKKLVYNETYHTNKVRIIIEHDLLITHKMQLMFEIFRA